MSLILGAPLTSINSLVGPINSVTSHIEEVPNLVQHAAGAAYVDGRAIVQVAQGSLDIAQIVSPRAVGGDAGIGQGLCKYETSAISSRLSWGPG